jgi:hypothetical protein
MRQAGLDVPLHGVVQEKHSDIAAASCATRTYRALLFQTGTHYKLPDWDRQPLFRTPRPLLAIFL